MLDLIKGKEVLVIGLARSGLAAVELLARHGAAKIIVTDHQEASDLQPQIVQLSRLSMVEIITGSNAAESLKPKTSMVIKSPGVPPGIPVLQRAAELKIPVYSEIELAYNFIKAPLIGVTGTNGKTTTTALIAAMLERARFNPVIAAGNIGNPLSEITAKIGAQGAIVAELSSFQLDDTRHFRASVALFINFSEDHLDYHGTLDRYFQAKIKIFANQKNSDIAVLNASDQQFTTLADQLQVKVLWFGAREVEIGFGLTGDWVTLFKPGFEPVKICLQQELALPGEHNLENALAASTAAWAAGADLDAIAHVLKTFKAIEHRLEHFTTINGVDYINDSKGTNPGSTIKALLAFPGRSKLLIAGGKNKGSDFSELAEKIAHEVRHVILIGETAPLIAAALEQQEFKSYQIAASLESAVEEAAKVAQVGEIVLLSPACASWDMFKDYEARGKRFKEIVDALKQTDQEGSRR